jgi:hypothetical protein
MVRRIFCFIVSVALAGCGAAGTDAPDTPEEMAAAASSGAEFRWHAKMAWLRLDDPCDFGPGLERSKVLVAERRAVADLENRIADSPASLHLDVARADAAFEQALPPKPDCSPASLALGSPPETRIGYARRDLSVALARMDVLTHWATGLGPLTDTIPATAGAEFRHLARGVENVLALRCPFSMKEDRFHTLADVRDEAMRFRERIGKTPFAIHYAIADADIDYEHMIVMVECADPDTPDTEQRVRSVTAAMTEALRRMERISQRR